ncbi:pentatricopeptide repeat-containing protein At2g13600-like [Selaginella moellendorffii]|uniref:pentatricopeptide repeat-containing protein At2g13600-like n=1 Tax=Selaginella moellendorffii TaxID=88036 RepID=UPI000D1CC25A|nr:pentatricopeptide repeat-containing protein At2g13600-like [Selaginella moellendorffii]|eukprot:XP_024543288.1 pentatricopeptide repeat-containing protein At2g13600-like [Selaginella moellendorffii]
MFAKCGSLTDARRVFDGMASRNVVSWTALMLGYAENREEIKALEALERMEREEGCAPNSWTFVAAAKACSNLAAAEEGEIIDGRLVKLGALVRAMGVHFQAVEKSCDSDIFVANSILDAYVKCGSLVDARMVFDRMVCRSVVSWTALVLGYVDNGEEEVALELVSCMGVEGCEPNARTLVAAVKACASLAEKKKVTKAEILERGRVLHCQAVELGFEDDIYIANTLVDMYAKCGSVVSAQRVFDRMPRHTSVSWNALMLGYSRNGRPEVTLELFEKRMATLRRGWEELTAGTFVAALKACLCMATKEAGVEVCGRPVKLESLEKGMAVHAQARKFGCDLDVCVGSSLVDLYGECGSMADASRAFARMPVHTVVSWDGLMLGYAQNEEPGAALEVFARMLQQGLPPDSRSFVAALKAWTGLAAMENAKQVSGKLVKARCLGRGIALHEQAEQSGFYSDRFVAGTLVDLYSKCGSLSHARRVFEAMIHCRDVVFWNALILGYAESEEGEVALELFARMDCAPDVLSFAAALKACGSLVALERTKLVHGEINRRGLLSSSEEKEVVLLTNSLLDAYAKCGSMEDAGCVFAATSSSTTRNLVTWNTLVAGHSRQANTREVLELFHALLDEGLRPNAVTFVCLLIACSRGGLVETARDQALPLHRRFAGTCQPTGRGREARRSDALQAQCRDLEHRAEREPDLPRRRGWQARV